MPSTRSALLAALVAAVLTWPAPGQDAKSPGKAGDKADPKQPAAPAFPTEIDGKKLDDVIPDLKHPDPSVREKTIRKVTLYGPPAAVAVPFLVERLQDKDASPRVRAIQAIGVLEVKDKDVPAVVEGLARRLVEDKEAVVRYNAAVALPRFGEHTRPVLDKIVQGIADPDAFEVRRACVIAVRAAAMDPKEREGKANGPRQPPSAEAVRALIEATKDPTQGVRLEAVVSLGLLGKPADAALAADADKALRGFLGGKDKLLGVWAHFSLCKLEEKPPEASLTALTATLKDPNVELRIEAARALGMLGPKAAPAVAAMTDALKDKNPNVVGELARALVHVGDKRIETQLMLTQLSLREDLDPGLREDILAALELLKQGKKP